MRIKALRLAWFRGAADAVTLGADGKSWGIYGCNGAGKSSFVDSIEYGIKGGKIGHLVSEYSGRNQENAIPNTHTPANCNTEFWIKFQDDSELNVKIARNGAHTRAGADAVKMDEWDYQRIILRQDEVAEFIRSRKGEKYSALLPPFGLHELEVAADILGPVSWERAIGRTPVSHIVTPARLLLDDALAGHHCAQSGGDFARPGEDAFVNGQCSHFENPGNAPSGYAKYSSLTTRIYIHILLVFYKISKPCLNSCDSS